METINAQSQEILDAIELCRSIRREQRSLEEECSRIRKMLNAEAERLSEVCTRLGSARERVRQLIHESGA